MKFAMKIGECEIDIVQTNIMSIPLTSIPMHMASKMGTNM